MTAASERDPLRGLKVIRRILALTDDLDATDLEYLRARLADIQRQRAVRGTGDALDERNTRDDPA